MEPNPTNFFIQFYNPKTKYSTNHNELSNRVITNSLISTLSITSDYINGKGKTISITIKNPRNIFNFDYAGNNTNLFGKAIAQNDWTGYLVPDGQFFVAKGTKAEWDTLSDEDKTKRLMGIFRINKPVNRMMKQSFNIFGQDMMKYPIRGVAYHNTGEVWQYPPDDWGDELMSVGQIVHDVFHKMGVYHYHKDGHIDNDPDGPLTPDGEIFYSTNMYFSPAEEKANEQIFDLVHPYDFIKKFSNYTGYNFFVKEKVINGTPRAVFYFKPPDYNDRTGELWGKTQIEFYNIPSSTHVSPIKVLDSAEYGLDDNDIRKYVITSTADSNSIVENAGQSGARMRNGSWMVGIIKEPDIKDLKDSKGNVTSSAAKAIGRAVMGQIEHYYRSLKIQFNNWIKFEPCIYNMDINVESLNIHVNDEYLCKSVTWVYNKFLTTTANFSFFSEDNIPKTTPTVNYDYGDQKVSVSFIPVGADSYKIYQDGAVVKTIDTPDREGRPVKEIIDGLTNGQVYTFYVGAIFHGQEVDTRPVEIVPGENDDTIGGGTVRCE